jgi:dolichyl-phosphate beta-glucosyltransferase
VPRLSLIIPCYNEARRIPGTLPRLAAYLETLAARGIPHEVLLVVERSPDSTLAIARQFAASHPGWYAIDNQVHRGKGHAVRSGMLRAQGDFACYMDADLSTDPAAIAEALSCLENNPTVAIIAGDRRHPGSTVTRNPGKSRPFLSRIFNLNARLLFPRSIKTGDTQCGFKMFRAAAARDIFPGVRIDGFAFDVEVFVRARRLGHRVLAMPVCWTDAPHSTVRAIRHSAQMFRDLLRLRLRFAGK